MKCYKSVQNVGWNGNIEMMYNYAHSGARPGQGDLPNTHQQRKELLSLGTWKKETNIICFYFFFAVDIEINGWYPNGRQYSDVLS